MISLDCQNKIAGYLINRPFFLTISLDLKKSSEVRKAGDRPINVEKYDVHRKHSGKQKLPSTCNFFLVKI